MSTKILLRFFEVHLVFKTFCYSSKTYSIQNLFAELFTSHFKAKIQNKQAQLILSVLLSHSTQNHSLYFIPTKYLICEIESMTM